MKPLRTTFTREGYEYRQIAKGKGIAVYRMEKGCHVAWEVIKVRQRAAGRIKDRDLEAREVYPPSEDWGVMGWTFTSKEAAYAKMDRLMEEQKQQQQAKKGKEQHEQKHDSQH